MFPGKSTRFAFVTRPQNRVFVVRPGSGVLVSSSARVHHRIRRRLQKRLSEPLINELASLRFSSVAVRRTRCSKMKSFLDAL